MKSNRAQTVGRWCTQKPADVSSGNTPKLQSQRLTLRRCKKDQDYQFLFDLMEGVLYSRRDENNAALAYIVLLSRDAHASPASNDIIQFIFFMRGLGIFSARGQGVNTGAQSRDAKEFEIQLSSL